MFNQSIISVILSIDQNDFCLKIQWFDRINDKDHKFYNLIADVQNLSAEMVMLCNILLTSQINFDSDEFIIIKWRLDTPLRDIIKWNEIWKTNCHSFNYRSETVTLSSNRRYEMDLSFIPDFMDFSN